MAYTGRPRILIVDDTEVNLILLETILRKEQAEVYKATSGPDALKLTLAIDFALIILDVSMPGMNGFELAVNLRKQETNRFTPIIFLSALLSDQQSIVQGYEAGAVDYLAKPYPQEVLLSKVRIFLKLYLQNRELQQQSKELHENLVRIKKAEQTIQFKYRFERAVSLASARFSGYFDAAGSIEIMLSDIASLCGAASAIYFSVKGPGSDTISSDPKDSGFKPPDAATINTLRKAFQNRADSPDAIVCRNETGSPWVQADAADQQKLPSVAIPVYLAETLISCILVNQCAGISDWDAHDLTSLAVFGTITGNALERAKTSKELRESESKYRSYIENAPEGILVGGSNGIILEANPAAQAMLGIQGKPLLNRNINALFQRSNLAGDFPEFRSFPECENSFAEFFIKQGKSARTIKAQHVKLPDGRFLIFCTDITAAREMEKHLIQTERLVGIGEMAAGIAHEINQPLNIISFGIDNLLHAIQTQKAGAEYIADKSKKIFDGIHRMRTIIDHVRTFSRSNDDFIHNTFCIYEPVENALSLIGEQYRNHGITLQQSQARDESLLVLGNSYKIEQVLLNLLSNARDAVEEKAARSEEGFKPLISIRCGRDKNHIVIKVTDNGTGIEPENLPMITTPFYTTKQPGKGTGLGLSISYGILKEHNGDLRFSGKPGEGTTVEVRLPAHGTLPET